MKKQRGQSLVEVVFAIGLIMMVITGIVFLLINTIGSRTKSYDRNRAVELSQVVMEGVVKTKDSDEVSFWDLGSAYWLGLGQTQTNTNFPDYYYSVTPTLYAGNGCSLLITQCINVTVNITWKNGNTDSQFNHFFSRK